MSTDSPATTFRTLDQLKSELQLLLAYGGDVVYRLRYGDMQYDYISPAIERLLGYTPEEVQQIGIRSLIIETRLVNNNMKPIFSFELLEEMRKRGEVHKWQADYLMRTKDGRGIWVSDVSYPWVENDAVVGSVGTLRDISERVDAESRAREEIERLSYTDQMTGFWNRHMFFTRLEGELKRIRRNQEDLSILLVDIDHLNKINTAYGQSAGDKIIASVARIIAGCLRETDTGARIGGDEFGAVLPDTPAAGAFWVAERIRSTVAKHAFTLGNMELPPVTVSVGIASARFDEHTDANALYKLADTRLFIAKQTGCNQVSMDEVVES